MKRFMLMTLAGLAALALSGAASSATASKTICVGNKVGCYSTLLAGLNAASDGDTIKLMPGTYAGGVTVDKSVALVGSGAGVTTISGGGPVLTIGVLHAATEPTVSITGLTVSGGLTTSSFGSGGSRAAGGGIQIPPNAACSGGATVQITNSFITGNTAQPSAAGTD
jgi:nitrous oxidase accessory protein NosD